MSANAILILLGGICQLGVLSASALVPIVLDWKNSLAPLPKLHRQLIWTYGAYVAGMIVSFGLLSVTVPELLSDGSTLARIVCGFIAAFWGVRLLLQFFVFESREFLTKWWLVAGHHGLTIVFIYLAAVYAWVAVAPVH
jgi:hypothetical protein